MKILFATTNLAKIKKYKDKLSKEGIELITINDLDFKLDIDENGKDAIENAYIKAKAYYDATKIITIGMDNCLFIEELPKEKQPGTHVRRINGKELNDEEMIEYYSNMVKEYGGKLTAKWVYGMVMCTDKGNFEHTWNKSDFYLVDKACKERNPGYPLDSISVMLDNGKYWLEMTEEDKIKNKEKDKKPDGVIEFILNNI
ncbi:MAG: hypothetical protein HFJ44_03445 [Clostridia bacterium]|jgi:XTP/dITP diphosphohydrolase|nr:hypothetical protein [Clostridia bacterium]